jgi:hypothetical protein
MGPLTGPDAPATLPGNAVGGLETNPYDMTTCGYTVDVNTVWSQTQSYVHSLIRTLDRDSKNAALLKEAGAASKTDEAVDDVANDDQTIDITEAKDFASDEESSSSDEDEKKGNACLHFTPQSLLVGNANHGMMVAV